MQDLREMKGELIAKEFGTVRRLDQHTYNVKSQSAEFEYEVMSTELGWICSCPDSMYRGSKCKHIWAVEFSFALRKAVKVDSVVIKPSYKQHLRTIVIKKLQQRFIFFILNLK